MQECRQDSVVGWRRRPRAQTTFQGPELKKLRRIGGATLIGQQWTLESDDTESDLGERQERYVALESQPRVSSAGKFRLSSS